MASAAIQSTSSRLDASKGKLYELSGQFRRDRQYFDYDLLNNPSIPLGLYIPIGPAGSLGKFSYPASAAIAGNVQYGTQDD